MRIIARRTLREFVASLAGHKDQPALKTALDNANNDTTFVQPTPCAFSFAP